MAASKVVTPMVTGDWNCSDIAKPAMMGGRETSGPIRVSLILEAKSIVECKQSSGRRDKGACARGDCFNY